MSTMEGPSKEDKEKWVSMELETATKTKSALDVVTDPLDKLFERLYGKMTWEEKLRLLWLASTLFFIIGGYWLLRSLKDPVISTICGVEYIPKAKMLSVLVVTVLVFVYNKLLDLYPKHQLFYIVGGFYAGLFTIIAIALASPATSSLSIYNTNADPYRLIGWISYCSIESFGSIGVSLFWAFTNSTYNLEGAKKAYGLMVACAQLGSIAGPTLVAVGTVPYGIPTMYFCGACCMVMMVISIAGYVWRFGVVVDEDTPAPSQEKTLSTKKKKAPSKAGMMEGLVLFWKYNYVKGIFALSCLFMVEVTILDYSMKVLANEKFSAMYPDDPNAAVAAFASFMGVFGQAANGLSFVFSLVGTSFIIRRFGLKVTVVLFPILCLGAICLVYLYPTLDMVFLMMLVLKALSYALNNPCKEILYQPTSSSIKYKAKSWIDVFGARGSKAFGSVFTNMWSDSAADLLTYGSFVAMGMSSFLIWVAFWMGAQFDDLITQPHKLGDEPEEEEEPASKDDDTSCGLDDDLEEEEDGDLEAAESPDSSAAPPNSKEMAV